MVDWTKSMVTPTDKVLTRARDSVLKAESYNLSEHQSSGKRSVEYQAKQNEQDAR